MTAVLDDLVERAQRGDEDAFASLAAATLDRCYAIAFRILRDTHRAEDATQAAMIGAWRDLSSLRDPTRFEGWLYRLVVNACYSRRGGIGTGWPPSSSSPRIARPSRILSVELADRDELERGFGQLSTEHRAVLVLHHYLGYPLTEIAQLLGIPLGTVRSRHHYAIRQLRAAIEADQRPTVAPGLTT